MCVGECFGCVFPVGFVKESFVLKVLLSSLVLVFGLVGGRMFLGLG